MRLPPREQRPWRRALGARGGRGRGRSSRDGAGGRGADARQRRALLGAGYSSPVSAWGCVSAAAGAGVSATAAAIASVSDTGGWGRDTPRMRAEVKADAQAGRGPLTRRAGAPRPGGLARARLRCGARLRRRDGLGGAGVVRLRPLARARLARAAPSSEGQAPRPARSPPARSPRPGTRRAALRRHVIPRRARHPAGDQREPDSDHQGADHGRRRGMRTRPRDRARVGTATGTSASWTRITSLTLGASTPTGAVPANAVEAVEAVDSAPRLACGVVRPTAAGATGPLPGATELAVRRARRRRRGGKRRDERLQRERPEVHHRRVVVAPWHRGRARSPERRRRPARSMAGASAGGEAAPPVRTEHRTAADAALEAQPRRVRSTPW